MVWMANRNVRMAHLQDGKIVASEWLAKIQEFFKIDFQTRKQLPIRTRMPETLILTRIRAYKAYK
jgi:hypothetical protein